MLSGKYGNDPNYKLVYFYQNYDYNLTEKLWL